MIDLLLKTVDRVIDLVKIKEKRIKARYEEVYKPSFVELQSVHTNYLNMFTELDSRLQKLGPGLLGNDPAAIDALEFLRARRTVLLPVRSKLLEKGSGSEVSPENNIIKQQAFDFARSQYIQHSRKVVMPAGMPTSSHKDLKL